VTLSRRARDLGLVAGLLLVALLMFRASSRKAAQLNWLDRLVLRASAPIQGAVSGAIDAVVGAWRGYVYLVDVQRENHRLSDENRRLQLELSRKQLAAERLGRVERLLNLRAEVPSETIAARVVGIDTSPHFRVVRVKLDRGAGEVKPGMVVLVPEGVVGRISRVFGPYSDVLLAVDPDSSIDVRVARTGARGVLKGIAGDNLYRTHIPEMVRGEEVREGDEVVTSGIGGFPSELPVGRVARVVKPDSGLWQEVVVSPSVDFARLGEVLVLLAPPPPPNPDGPDTAHRAPEPVRGLRPPR
jgi:rod shape-determining protein MreC